MIVMQIIAAILFAIVTIAFLCALAVLILFPDYIKHDTDL